MREWGLALLKYEHYCKTNSSHTCSVSSARAGSAIALRIFNLFSSYASFCAGDMALCPTRITATRKDKTVGSQLGSSKHNIRNEGGLIKTISSKAGWRTALPIRNLVVLDQVTKNRESSRNPALSAHDCRPSAYLRLL